MELDMITQQDGLSVTDIKWLYYFTCSMTGLPDGGEKLSAPPQNITADEISMNLTMCDLLPDYATDLTLLFEYFDR